MLMPTTEDHDRFLVRCVEISSQYNFEHALKQTLVFAIASAEHQILFINRIKRGVAANLCDAIPSSVDQDAYKAMTRLLAAGFSRDAERHDVMGKLNRYEAEQHRILYRAIQMLETLYDKWKKDHEANPIPVNNAENKPVERPPNGFASAPKPKIAVKSRRFIKPDTKIRNPRPSKVA